MPPPEVFEVVKYTSPAGELAAYLTPDPKDEKQHPAILWITGGDCNTIGDVWSPQPAANDQTAAAFRQAGIVMMFPSLRGGNQNPGVREGFYGEVDDVLAAADYLAKQPYVDPQRIYLGGHSTGGTMVMLVAAVSDRFRAVFSFGPVDNISGYGSDFAPMVNLWDSKEVQLRSPKYWLHSIKSPTFVFEGASQGNGDCLTAMKNANTNPLAQFFLVSGKDHFSVIAPVNQLLAQKVLADTGEKTNIAISAAELSR
jgi:dipeptidyl aminopeptidase/acylaminoacyl peptidase